MKCSKEKKIIHNYFRVIEKSKDAAKFVHCAFSFVCFYAENIERFRRSVTAFFHLQSFSVRFF